MADRKLQELWAELDGELGRLRTVFDGSAPGEGALRSFDEYLSANEFGLALETLCDFLLDSNVPTVTPSLLLEIQRLHTKMGVDDNCVRNLRQKGSAEHQAG
jgi:hypothetical protein